MSALLPDALPAATAAAAAAALAGGVLVLFTLVRLLLRGALDAVARCWPSLLHGKQFPAGGEQALLLPEIFGVGAG